MSHLIPFYHIFWHQQAIKCIDTIFWVKKKRKFYVKSCPFIQHTEENAENFFSFTTMRTIGALPRYFIFWRKYAKSGLYRFTLCRELFEPIFRYATFILHTVKGRQKQHVVPNHKSKLGILNNFLENHLCT